MDEQAVVKELSIPLYQSKGWIQFLGIVMIIQGILAALTIIGIVFAWLPIWLGVLLFRAAGAVDSAAFTGDKHQFLDALRNLKTYFIINGLVMLISVGFLAVVFFLGGMAALMGF